MRRAVVVVALLSLLGVALPASVHAHSSGTHSISINYVIRWTDFTKYDGSRDFAVNAWRELGEVRLPKHTTGYPQHLQFRDYKNCADYKNGFWDGHDTTAWNSGANIDHIRLNTCNFDNHLSVYQRQAVIGHEIGHALGLHHNPEPQNLMNANAALCYCRTPGSHETWDYLQLWSPRVPTYYDYYESGPSEEYPADGDGSTGSEDCICTDPDAPTAES